MGDEVELAAARFQANFASLDVREEDGMSHIRIDAILPHAAGPLIGTSGRSAMEDIIALLPRALAEQTFGGSGRAAND